MTTIIPITSFTAGTVKGSDVYPAVDVTDTTQATAGTTKQYEIADLLNFTLNALGLHAYSPCLASTTVNLTAAYDNGIAGVGATLTNSGALAPFSIDGMTGIVGQRYLIKNMVNPAYTGIYTLTVLGTSLVPWVLTRAIDFNSSSNIINGGTVFVTEGTTNANTFWKVTYTGLLNVGITLLVWTPFSLSPSTSFNWNLVTGTSQTIAPNNGYVTSNSGLTTFLLPPTCQFGETFRIGGRGTGGWQLSQAFGQQIFLGSASTTAGILGYLASTNRDDCIEVLCTADNAEFLVLDVVGNITIN